jgi:hypothetical protein
VDVATVLGRGAKTDPHGWDVVEEAELGLEGVAVGVVVVPWEGVPWVSIVGRCGGLQGDTTHDHGGAVLVGGGLGMLLAG